MELHFKWSGECEEKGEVEDLGEQDVQIAKLEEDLAEKRTRLQELEWGGDSK